MPSEKYKGRHREVEGKPGRKDSDEPGGPGFDTGLVGGIGVHKRDSRNYSSISEQ